MTSRERLMTVLRGEIPDCVPAAPDTSNMIPAKLTGKPFWDLYLYRDPPIWKAYIDCVKHFGFDSLMDGYVDIAFDDMPFGENRYDRRGIVFKNDERIVTRNYAIAGGKRFWDSQVTVYYRGDPPSFGVDPAAIKLDAEPSHVEEITGVREWPRGAELLSLVKREMGEYGLVGVFCGTTKLINTEAEIYDYYDNPEKYAKKRDYMLSYCEKKLCRLMSLAEPPDFICTGGSGTLIHQTPQIFRKLALPIVKRITAMCKEYGVPSHIHSCGPEKELVKICAEETDLTVIDPLEIPPMGNCDLRELKRLYGHKLVLKGNLHTTSVMLNGTSEQVREAARRAIDNAAEGGRFILSTGDQCGRDTPPENIHALIDTARTYGRY